MRIALIIAGLVQLLESAYVMEHLDGDLCGRSLVLKSVWAREGVGSTAMLSLDDERTTPCYLHISVPSMHVIAMHLIPAYTMTLPSRLKVKNYDPRWSLAFNASDAPLLSRLEFRGHEMNNITLIWQPCESSGNCIKSEPYRLVVTAVGRGKAICRKGKVTPCKVPRRLDLIPSEESCVSAHLTCDGFGNCPLADDEQNCGIPAVVDTLFQDVSRQLLTRLLHRGIAMLPQAPSTTTSTTTTTTSLPPISDVEKKTGNDSFPAILARYGPWGYLLMGMVLCTVVLMLCGLYECCCKATKTTPGGALPSTSATTTVFIISSGGIPNPVSNVTPPATPGPPSYDELDQPPSYADLFPMTKLKKSSEDEPEQPPQEEPGT